MSLSPRDFFNNAQAGEAFGLALGAALLKRAEQKNITATKNSAIKAWCGGAKKICKPCYEKNLELKRRVELTTLMALQLQNSGYGLQDSIDTARTAVLVDLGDCYIPQCQ